MNIIRTSHIINHGSSAQPANQHSTANPIQSNDTVGERKRERPKKAASSLLQNIMSIYQNSGPCGSAAPEDPDSPCLALVLAIGEGRQEPLAAVLFVLLSVLSMPQFLRLGTEPNRSNR